MNCKTFGRAVSLIAVLALAAGSAALAQTPRHMKFSGTINDYTPASTAGPWEVRGHWTLEVKGDGKADFSAALTMERSDQGVLQNGGGDLNSATDRNAHTHHIVLCDGEVTAIPNGFRVTAPAKITANGAFPPPFGPTSSLQIDITGGNEVTFSNIAVTLQEDAAMHFGTQPMHGVVRVARGDDDHGR